MLRVASILIFALAVYFWYSAKATDIAFAYLAAPDLSCGSAKQPCMVGERSYNIIMPRGDGPFPAVLFFHGSGGNGAKVIRSPRVALNLLQSGYALIAPSALDITYSGGRRFSGWIWEGSREGRDEYGFIRSVMDDAVAKFPIRSEEMIVAGHSNGATLVWYLACAGIDNRLRDFAPIGGTPVRDRPLTCADAQQTFNLLHTHGRFDRVVPINGTQNETGFPGWQGAQEAVEMIAMAADCAEDIAEDAAPSTLVYQCFSGTEFRLDITDGGHEIPEDWAATVIAWSQNQP